jgi:hypothetical protein
VHLAEKDRRVVGAPFLHGLSHIPADKQRVVPEVSFVFRQRVVGDPHRRHVQHFHALQIRSAPGQSLHQFHRLGAAVVYIDAVPRLHCRQSLVRRHDP